MSDLAIPFDADPVADFKLDFDQRTVNAQLVATTKVILVDGTLNQKAAIDASGNLSVKLSTQSLDSTSKGVSGDAPVSIAVSGDTQLLATATTRRAVWLTNTALAGGPTLWVRIGGGAAIVGRGVPIYPGYTICFDKAPNAAYRAISDGAAATMAIGYEGD